MVTDLGVVGSYIFNNHTFVMMYEFNLRYFGIQLHPYILSIEGRIKMMRYLK